MTAATDLLNHRSTDREALERPALEIEEFLRTLE